MFRLSALLSCALFLAAFTATAQTELAQPEGRVILEVSGAIGRGNATDAAGNPIARFDRRMLTDLPQTKLTTATDFTDGEQVFEGVLLKDLLDHVVASGADLRAVALNDYTVVIPTADTTRYPVLLALLHNGETMPVRAKGPIWIIYPAETPAGRMNPHAAKMVWQLARIVVERPL